ncbi:MAG: hypothetical protein EBZ67_11605, partial [Chitinophagia bacterium]|nr:hypothetical protein [Chitinophagia bacterium]
MELDITTVPCIGSAMHQNGVSLVRDVRLRHEDPGLEGRLLLRLSVTPEVFSPFEVGLDAPAGVAWRSGPLEIPLHWKELASLTEGVNGLLLAELEDAEGRLLLTQERQLRFLTFDQWQGTGMMPELLAAFVTPNHPRIPGVLRRAADLLASWGEPPSLNEYQSRSPDRVRKQAAALYGAISELGVTYAAIPASFEEAGQRIRLCDQLFDQGIGNCIDMSLLFASCAEAAGLHPIVVFVKGHAFVGLWLVEETFPDPVNDDITLLSKRNAEGIHDILLLEATGMNRGARVDFETAVARAGAYLLKPEEFLLFVDVRRARHARIRPLPIRIRTDEGWVAQEPTDASAWSEAGAPGDISVGPRPDERITVTHTRQQTWERRLLDLTLRNTRIYHTSSSGLIGVRSRITAENCLIYKNLSNSVVLSHGGDYSFSYSTICSYGVNAAALSASNYFCYDDPLLCRARSDYRLNASFRNCIFFGSQKDQIRLADVSGGNPASMFNLSFQNCVVRAEGLLTEQNNRYAQFFQTYC